MHAPLLPRLRRETEEVLILSRRRTLSLFATPDPLSKRKTKEVFLTVPSPLPRTLRESRDFLVDAVAFAHAHACAAPLGM
jgi:hypothetical protein